MAAFTVGFVSLSVFITGSSLGACRKGRPAFGPQAAIHALGKTTSGMTGPTAIPGALDVGHAVTKSPKPTSEDLRRQLVSTASPGGVVWIGTKICSTSAPDFTMMNRLPRTS